MKGCCVVECFFSVFDPQKSTSNMLRMEDLFVVKSWSVVSVFFGGMVLCTRKMLLLTIHVTYQHLPMGAV